MAVQEEERVDDLLNAGQTALKAGDKETATARFRKAAEISPYDERVWQALLDVVTEPEDERVCLQNILAINPGNKKARRRMAGVKPEAAAPAIAVASPLPSAPAPVVAPPLEAVPVASPEEIQAAAEKKYEKQEKTKRARSRRWRAFRNGFGQGLLIGFCGSLVGLVLSLFIYGIGGSGGVLDVWFAPIRALYQ
ncbi:MAG: hypothetical protein U0452_13820 [Anaerolineae bacterium]